MFQEIKLLNSDLMQSAGRLGCDEYEMLTALQELTKTRSPQHARDQLRALVSAVASISNGPVGGLINGIRKLQQMGPMDRASLFGSHHGAAAAYGPLQKLIYQAGPRSNTEFHRLTRYNKREFARLTS